MYVVASDLTARFEARELIDLTGLEPDDVAGLDAAAIDARVAAVPRVQQIIADTCAEIDSVLVETYALPLPSGTWPLLKAIGADIARARLYDDEAPDRVLGRLSSARKKLREVGTGERRLVSADGVEAPRHATVLVDAPGPTFTRARLTEYLEPTPTSYGPFGQG